MFIMLNTFTHKMFKMLNKNSDKMFITLNKLPSGSKSSADFFIECDWRGRGLWRWRPRLFSYEKTTILQVWFTIRTDKKNYSKKPNKICNIATMKTKNNGK